MLKGIFLGLHEDLHRATATWSKDRATIERKPEVRCHEFYAGIHLANNTPYIRMVLDKEIFIPVKLPACKGFEVKWTDVRGKCGNLLSNLMIVGKEQSQMGFHIAIMEDIIAFAESIADKRQMAVRIIERLHEWSDYFDRCSDALLSMNPSSQKGMYGELRFLEKLLEQEEPMTVIVAWRGPEKQSHDFKFPTVHYEVKTLTIDQTDKVNINGMSQITQPKEKELIFYIGKVDVNESIGETLQDIVQRIESKLKGEQEAVDLLWKKLFKMNYPKTGIDNGLFFHERLVFERWYLIPSTLSKVLHDPCLQFKETEFYPHVFEHLYPECVINENEALKYLISSYNVTNSI